MGGCLPPAQEPPGYKVCGVSCVPTSAICCDDPTGCPSGPVNGFATCNGNMCGTACNRGFRLCGNVCIADDVGACCPATVQNDCGAVANASVSCSSYACTFSCNSGFQQCGDQCISNAACCPIND